MRPLHLELTAFGPFGGTESLDFTTLPADRPFVVGGRTGAGKSSVFDAMTYALYGMLPGHRRNHGEPRSSFADPAVECSVTFEFEVRDERWRVTRAPAQLRASRRGADRLTRRAAGARLERFAQGRWEPHGAKVTEVTAACTRLVGLDATQFQRVVLLPQADFAAVLHASTTEREPLLRTLFGTSIYPEAVERLKAEQAGLQEDLRRAGSDAVGQLRSLHRHLCELGDLLASPEDPPDGVVVDLAVPEDLPGSPTELHGVVVEAASRLDALGGPMGELRGAAADAARLAAAAARGLARSEAVAAAVAERDRCVARRAELQAVEPEHERRTARLAAHEAAGPAVEARDRLAGATRRAVASAEVVKRRWADAVALGGAATAGSWGEAHGGASLLEPLGWEEAADPSVELAEVRLRAARRRREQLGAVVREAERAVEAFEEATRLDEQLIAGTPELASTHEALDGAHRALRELQRRRDAAELATADRERRVDAVGVARSRVEALEQLASARRERGGAEQRRAGCAAVLEGLDQRRQVLREEHDRIRPSAGQAEEARRRRDVAADRLGHAHELRHHRARRTELVEIARQREAESSAMVAAFLSDAAAVLAATLEPGEACAVCGSTAHPAPAVPSGGGDPVDHTGVEAARALAQSATAEVADCDSLIAVLLAEGPGIDTAGLDDLEAELQEATSRSRRAERDAVRLGELDAEIAELDARVAVAAEALADADADLAALRTAEARAEGELGDPERDHAARAAAVLAAATEALEEADRAAGELEALGAQVEVAARESEALGAAVADRERQRLDSAARRDLLGEEAARLRAAVRVAVGDVEPSAPARALDAAIEALEAARAALVRAAGASEELERAEQELAAAVADGPFASVAEALDARLDPQVAAELAGAVRSHERDCERIEVALATLAGQDLPSEAPDVDADGARAEELAQRADQLRSAEQRAELLDAAARRVLDELRACTGAASPLGERAEALSSVVSVLSGERTRPRVSLEAWVLRRHLEEVALAANVHLGAMTHGRYELVVQEPEPGAAGRAGLDLVVLDSFNGATRATRSLSGGETFQASLAMALGLADVLMARHGGLHLDAVFVDEGFGALDAEAVEVAVSVLDGLRGRGTMVGVVTHVEAMKEALGVAVEVEQRPDRRGSRISQRVPVGLG